MLAGGCILFASHRGQNLVGLGGETAPRAIAVAFRVCPGYSMLGSCFVNLISQNFKKQSTNKEELPGAGDFADVFV